MKFECEDSPSEVTKFLILISPALAHLVAGLMDWHETQEKSLEVPIGGQRRVVAMKGDKNENPPKKNINNKLHQLNVFSHAKCMN